MAAKKKEDDDIKKAEDLLKNMEAEEKLTLLEERIKQLERDSDNLTKENEKLRNVNNSLYLQLSKQVEEINEEELEEDNTDPVLEEAKAAIERINKSYEE